MIKEWQKCQRPSQKECQFAAYERHPSISYLPPLVLHSGLLLEMIPAALWGECRVSHRTSCQFIPGPRRGKQPLALTFTPCGRFGVATYPCMSLDCGRKQQCLEGNPCTHRENKLTPYNGAQGWRIKPTTILLGSDSVICCTIFTHGQHPCR